DAVRWPVGGECSPDDPRCGDRAPEAAVVGFSPVVAHHEPMSRGYLDRRREITDGCRRLRAGFDVRVSLAHTIAVGVTFLDVDFIAGTRNNTLDEVHARLLRERL